MQRPSPEHPHPLHDTAATRALEAAAGAALPPHTLMQRAGRATARLALALAPHARRFWVACGSGNNGGDGLEAAALLHRAGHPVCVSLLGEPARLPPDAARSWQRARDAGVAFADTPPALGPQDLCIDALLGVGLAGTPRAQAPDPRLARWLAHMRASGAGTLCVDLPSGLMADTGQWAPGFGDGAPPAPGARHTLSLLTLKPGLFTAHGRDAAGTVWFDGLAIDAGAHPPTAWLEGAPPGASRAHACHKGSFGDVAVVGGEGLAGRGMGMTGAAVLAALAALHGGAGRVLLALLDAGATAALPQHPELMLRRFDALDLERGTVVCGCGGGSAVVQVLPEVLARSRALVLDADALNAIAADGALQQALASRGDRATVLTPHPLEAARLLESTTAAVQADRLAAASALARRFGCTVVLKGSGSVSTAPGLAPRINPTGNALLATAGTGDVLAGLAGARLAAAPHTGHADVLQAAGSACWLHGAVADAWPAGRALTASRLALALGAAARPAVPA